MPDLDLPALLTSARSVQALAVGVVSRPTMSVLVDDLIALIEQSQDSDADLRSLAQVNTALKYERDCLQGRCESPEARLAEAVTASYEHGKRAGEAEALAERAVVALHDLDDEHSELVNWFLEMATQAEEQIAGLIKRRDELLVLVRNISQSTPLVAELEGWEGQRAALVAEVGTLRAQVDEVNRDAVRWHRYAIEHGQAHKDAQAMLEEIAASRAVLQSLLDLECDEHDAEEARLRAELAIEQHAHRTALDTIRQLRLQLDVTDAIGAVEARAVDKANRAAFDVLLDELDRAVKNLTPDGLRVAIERLVYGARALERQGLSDAVPTKCERREER